MFLMKHCCGVVAIMFLATLEVAAAASKRPTVQTAGTYTNLHFIEEAGDLLGLEIKIVPVAGGYQAAVLRSEGEPQPMVVVDLRVQGTSVAFDVRGEDGLVEWTFAGTVTARSLSGTISHARGAKEQVVLPRRCGYWDR
jgi:hypothetical protein